MVKSERNTKGCGMSKRNVLWHCVFWGFAVNYMVRINLNIAIVAMLRHRKADTAAKQSQCFVAVQRNVTNTSLVDGDGDEVEQNGFLWDEYQVSLILGAFYWIHWVSQVPGGVLARKIGTKRLFGFSNLAMCLLGLLIPAASHWDYSALIVLRVLQGFIGGVCWPSMHNMAASWIPPNERSSFMTAYLGSSVGSGLTFFISGLLIDWFDWPSVFYATAFIGSAWFVAWWFLVYDTPAKHPRISQSERDYIQDSLGRSVQQKKMPVPWRRILTSRVMWVTAFSQCGGLWGLFTMLTQAPTYLKQIHGWDIRMTGFLSGLPNFFLVIFAYILSYFADRTLKQNAISRTKIRKLATVVGTIGQGIFMLGLAFCGCNWLAAIICVVLATTVTGSISTGPLAAFVDLSPNYASITLGISNMISVLPGFLSPVLVGALTYQNQTVEQWQIVFLISAAIVALPGILYVFFGTSELQTWNSPEEYNKDLQILRPNEKQVQRQQMVHSTLLPSEKQNQEYNI